MRHLLLVMCITLALAAFDEVAATGFSNPLAAMTVVQPFGGSGGTHIGTDLDGTAGDAIYAIADGQVCFYDGSATAYGGGSGNCARDGAVLFVRHRKSNGDYFIAQYGHIQNVSSAFQQITTYTENGPSVSQGQKIAEIGVYTPKRDCSLGRADHLHFGIWDSNNSIPMNSWGYSSDPCWTNPQGCWFDPMTFLVNENPYMFYSCEFTSQSISPVGPYGPGQLVTCQVRYRNTGSSTWHNDPIVHPESYVELASTNEAGVPSESFFNFPPDAPDPDVNWKTDIVPCTMQETSVAPGAIATFNFQGRVNLNATPGNHKIYFGPTHNGTVLPGWGEMHYPIVVSAGWVATVPTNDCSGPVDGALQWHQPDFTPRYGPWRAVAVPDAGWGCDGCDRFYRFWYEYPGTASGLGASLEFHADNAITLYVNGQFVGEWGSGCHTDACVNPPYNCSVNYHAPDADITSYLHQGSNLIAAHVSDGGGIEYFSLSVNEHPLLIMEKAICCLGGNTCLPITPGYTSANCQQDNGQLYIGGWLDCGQFSSCNNPQQKIKHDPVLFYTTPLPIPNLPAELTFVLDETKPRTIYYDLPAFLGGERLYVSDFSGQLRLHAQSTGHPDTVDLTITEYQFDGPAVQVSGKSTGINHVRLDTAAAAIHVGKYSRSSRFVEAIVQSVLFNDLFPEGDPVHCRSQIRGHFDLSTGILEASSEGYSVLPSPCIEFACGDIDGSCQVDIGDAVALIMYMFAGGATPVDTRAGDVNCDGKCNIADAVYLVNYIFRSGQEPCHGC